MIRPQQSPSIGLLAYGLHPHISEHTDVGEEVLSQGTHRGRTDISRNWRGIQLNGGTPYVSKSSVPLGEQAIVGPAFSEAAQVCPLRREVLGPEVEREGGAFACARGGSATNISALIQDRDIEAVVRK